MVYADTTRILDRMESVRVNLTASCFRKYLTDSAPAILSFLPALRTFCLAARRQNVADLVNFIGKKELIWLELTCCNVLVALEKGNVCLVDLEKNDSFWEQITPILAFDKQLRIVRSGLSEIERTFLRERKDAQHATQPSYSWGSIWFAAADALDYISGEDRDWFKVKCDLAGWGNGLFHTKLTLDHVLQDEKAYENLHPTIVNGFTWILVYAGSCVHFIRDVYRTVLTHVCQILSFNVGLTKAIPAEMKLCNTTMSRYDRCWIRTTYGSKG